MYDDDRYDYFYYGWSTHPEGWDDHGEEECTVQEECEPFQVSDDDSYFWEVEET